MVIYMRQEHFSLGQPCPGSKGAGAQRPPIFRDPAYAKPVTHMGRNMFLRHHPRPHSKGVWAQYPQDSLGPVLMPIWFDLEQPNLV